MSNVVAIAAGSYHALAIKSDGTVAGWGYNADGEIDVPSSLSNVVAIAGGWNQSVALKSNGQVVGWGQTTIPASLSNVVAIACGLFHNLALRADGTVVGWGFDYDGSISGIAALTNVVAIAAGGYHSLAITSEGAVTAFGYDLYGQADVPSNLGGNLVVSGSVNPNAVGTYTLNYTATNDLGGSGMAMRTVTVVDTTPPTITLLGANPLTMPVNTAYTELGATAMDACAGDLTASIVVSGTVDTSVLGTNILTYSVADPSGNVANTNRIIVCVVGSPFVSTFPAAVSFGRASLLGTVNPNGAATTAWFEWGTNVLYGRLTKPTALGNGLTNVTLRGTLAGLIPGMAYHYRIVATNSAGTSAGRDVVFQNSARVVKPPAVMLRGPNPMTNECHSLFTDPGAVTVAPLSAISASGYYSLALKTDGTVGAWGNGPAVPAALTNVTAIAAGYIHDLALRADGTVVGWGDNAFGETNTPLGLKDAVAIAAGWGYSLALRADGTLVCWGMNNYTPAPIPPGLSNVTAVAAGFDLCLAAKSDGSVVGWGHPSFGGTAPPASLSNAVAVAAGFSFGLGLTAQGTVEGWGYNGEGQTSVPDNLSNVVAIAAGFYHSLALKADGTVVGWGDDFYGEATPPPGLNNVVAITAGPYHSLALRRDGTVVGWGSGFYGETDITTAGTNLVVAVRSVNGTVNANDPGWYTLTYRATNAQGEVTSLSRKVVVVDTTPPTIDCPTNQTVEFEDEHGTRMFFHPKATDLCSPYVSIDCSPRSGSVFPIGTSTVQCTALDVSRNAASCSFQITVLGPQGVKSNVLSELTATCNSLTNAADYACLIVAISNLQQSLSPSYWIDQTHLSQNYGARAFEYEASAVGSLAKQIQRTPRSSLTRALRVDIERIVKSDRLLAVSAIEDAARANPNANLLAAARRALILGDYEAAREQYLEGITYYRKAWAYISPHELPE